MEKQSSKLPILFPNKSRDSKPGCYLVTSDLFHKEVHNFKGDNGETFTLYTPRDQSNNIKERNPNLATVVAAFGDTDFKKGDVLVIDHYVLKNHDDSLNHIWEDEKGVKYWKVENYDVFGCLEGDRIKPNSEILLCEYLEDKLIETTLDLAASLVDKRQDLAKIVFSSDDKYKPGQYILVEDYALYEIEHEGKKYAKVDISMNDIMAVVDSPKWRKDIILNMNLSDVKEPI